MCGDGDLQAIGGAEPVLGAQLQAEGVARLTEQPEPELRPVLRYGNQLPAGPPGKAVNGIAVRGFGQVKLEALAAEGIAAVIDPVRPGHQEFAGSGRRELVRAVLSNCRYALV